MSRLRDEITRTLLRLSKSGSAEPPFHSVADAGDDESGRILGPYKLIRRLGVGGMGHVYLAFDSRLNRHAALKFLSPDLVSDRDMLARLQTEARTASSLNHPNILTIYEIGELEGKHFIASEYVQGLTVREAIEGKLIDVPTALDITSQIASALVAAHSAGIIHRDLKPGNLMIREDGYVKVIDFGLAKRIQRLPRRAESDLGLTRPGTMIGTVHYMSPEQASGGIVDARSDLWSLGVILFELLTNHVPFDGPSETAIIESIRQRSVPELPGTLQLPPGLDRLLWKALAKDPAQRFQDAREALAALGAMHRPATDRTTRPIRLKPNRTYTLWLAAAVATLLVGALVWSFALRDRLFQPSWFSIDKVRQLTFNGRVTQSALSPDGKYLAYVAGELEGMQTLYLSQLDTATEQIKVPGRRETYLGLTFSPDNKIYAVSEGPDLLGKLYVIPLIGEAPEKPILVDIDGPAAFSPAGDHFAFVRFIHSQHEGREVSENAVFVANSDGSGARKLSSTTGGVIVPQLAWSPDTNQIAALYISGSAGSGDKGPSLHLLRPDGAQTIYRLPEWRIIGRPWWSDRYSLILTAAARSESSSQLQIQQVDIRRSVTRNITRDLAGYRSTTLSGDRNLLAAVKTESRRSLWVSASRDYSRGQTSLAELARYPTLAWLNSDRILIDSLRGGYPNLWQVDVNALTRTSVTSEAFAEQDAVPVPKTKAVVLASNRSGEFKIWRFDPDTNTYTQLTFGPSYDQSPAVSPDGRWIVYTSWYASASHLRKVSVSGGESQLLLSRPAKDAQFSPDGRQVACFAKAADTWSAAVLPFDHPDQLHALSNVSPPMTWSPDGRSLHSVVTDTHGVSNIWSTPLAGGHPRRITTFEDQRILKFAWSPAGDRLACLRESFGSDVTLFSRPKSP